MTATDLILARFAGLSPTLQQAAKFALDHPNEVVVGSMRTLAQRAGAQPASFVRLAQALGLPGWPALKQAFAAELGLDTQGYGQRAKKLAGRGRDSALLGELFAVQRRNLDATEAHCAASLRGAAKILRRAGAVHVAGFRACFAIASSLVYGYRLFRPSVHLVDGLGGALEMQLRSVQPRDAVEDDPLPDPEVLGPEGEPIEPTIAVANEGEFPTLTDQGEGEQVPRRRPDRR